MTVFDVLNLIGGLCLFLFGMNLMGNALERRAGHSLTRVLGRLTGGKLAGFLIGLGVTAVIQSSSATTVMVVGFVNSGIMTLGQAINVIMGANVGTTVTAWLLSLTGIESGNLFVQLLKPSSFTPVLALVGIILYMGFQSSRKKDTATILLGFATLMFGMDTMSSAVAGLEQVEGFRNILLLFTNPVLGVLAGAVLTAVIQSSSASVGILQALSSTGQISFGAAVPIIMGQNIGTCVTALLSSIGTSRNARRASVVHLCFNVLGTALLLSLFCLVKWLFDISLFTDAAASEVGIAAVHTVFNILCTAIMLPAGGLLEKLSYRLVPEPKDARAREERLETLDERLMATPFAALARCRDVTAIMGRLSVESVRLALDMFRDYDPLQARRVRKLEDISDRYEDMLGSYLVKLSAQDLSEEDSREVSGLLHRIGDLERLSDHAVNLLESAEEMRAKKLGFSSEAQNEMELMFDAVRETLDRTMEAFEGANPDAALRVEPLEQIADVLKKRLRSNHIRRMQKGGCSIEAGFVWSDLLTNLERVSDHCANIAGSVNENSGSSLELHSYARELRADSEEFDRCYREYAEKYLVPLES